MNDQFHEARRENTSVLASAEKRLLVRLAHLMPSWVNSDHLTALGFAGTLAAAAAYGLCAVDGRWVHIVNLALLVNWFGDSLDGTLARVRNLCRPRYGFYVDHILDALGSLVLVLGLGVSGLITPAVAIAVLLAYNFLTINISLSTYALGVFKISYGPMGGTELRILLAAVNLVALRWPEVTLGGLQIRIFDAAGTVGAVILAVIGISLMVRNTLTLYRAEPLPKPTAVAEISTPPRAGAGSRLSAGAPVNCVG
jgi:archaetidylinositol phosphate synthase